MTHDLTWHWQRSDKTNFPARLRDNLSFINSGQIGYPRKLEICRWFRSGFGVGIQCSFDELGYFQIADGDSRMTFPVFALLYMQFDQLYKLFMPTKKPATISDRIIPCIGEGLCLESQNCRQGCNTDCHPRGCGKILLAPTS